MLENTQPTLLDRVRDQHDETAWAQFDKTYRPILVRYARQNKLGAEAADEIAQQCLMKLWKRLKDFEYRGQPGSFRAYLRRIVVNAVYDAARNAPVGADSEILRQAHDSQRTAEECYAEIEEQELALRCLELIRPELRGDKTYEIFTRRVIDGWSFEKLRDEYGVTRAQVDGIKFRVSRRLKQKIAELYGNTRDLSEEAYDTN